jgi:hypothetical protein
MNKSDIAKWKCRYSLEKRNGDIDSCRTPQERLDWLKNTIPYEVIEREDNCLLNSGIDEIWDLVTGDSANHFNNAGAEIGVGDSSTAAAAAQTDLQAAVNKVYVGMEATFPTSTTQKITFKSSFGDAVANWVWNEWVVRQSTSEICLNRKVDSLGTKAAGTWTLTVSITLS